uniref:Peptide deformylase n=1 Tax=Trypanosoma congolense (strain IL3000) TaxID=1068625 RepID=G0UU27_TRYCI|nr:unnamed protein product [Trypanosoma congolense IL3000]
MQTAVVRLQRVFSCQPCSIMRATDLQSLRRRRRTSACNALVTTRNHGDAFHSVGESPYEPGSSVHVEHPIVQLPARSLWCKQYPLNVTHLRRGDFRDMITRVKAARHYYQYPSLCAPQIGWNVQMFTLFDGTVFINPINLDAQEVEKRAEREGVTTLQAEAQWMEGRRREGKTSFAWEPCASCCFLLHFIERPSTVRLRAVSEDGSPFEVTLDKMRARMALHEMDHLNGILFTRRIPDTNHVVPLEGFSTMSEWPDDYPSLEARSTFLYTTFTPPYTFTTDNVDDAQLLDRKFEDGIYPGCELDRRMRIESAAMEELQRAKWRMEKTRDEDCGGMPEAAAAEEEEEVPEGEEAEGE